MNNKLYPWIILVPERDEIREIFELKAKDRKMLIDEIAVMSETLKSLYWPDKINVAALGNQVEQLHVHIIARFKTDDVWPEPIWGKGSKSYDKASVEEIKNKLRKACSDIKGFVTIANQP